MLYIIPTPIGNKEDITLRALRMFKELEYFFCEDTRMTKKLLNIYEIDYQDKQFYSLTSFTNQGKLNHYLNILKENDCGLVSDAGSPGISDPGKELIRIVWENNLDFETLPGANALVPALVGSCFDTSEFSFYGFLPKKKGRQTSMKKIINSEIPCFVYESVHRIEKLIIDIKELGFDGKVALFREISKMHEQKVCKNIDTMLTMLSSGEIKQKGEFVVGFKNNK